MPVHPNMQARLLASWQRVHGMSYADWLATPEGREFAGTVDCILELIPVARRFEAAVLLIFIAIPIVLVSWLG